MMLRLFIIMLPSFVIPKNNSSLTLETKFKVELNMGDLAFFFSRQFVPLTKLQIPMNTMYFAVINRQMYPKTYLVGCKFQLRQKQTT